MLLAGTSLVLLREPDTRALLIQAAKTVRTQVKPDRLVAPWDIGGGPSVVATHSIRSGATRGTGAISGAASRPSTQSLTCLDSIWEITSKRKWSEKSSRLLSGQGVVTRPTCVAGESA